MIAEIIRAALNRWLTPKRGILIAVLALLVGLIPTLLIVAIPKWRERRDHYRQDSGWLPNAQEVTAVHVSGIDALGQFSDDLPVETGSEVLASLARRTAWKKVIYAPSVPRKSRDRAYSTSWIELSVSSMPEPVRIGTSWSDIVQIGNQLFELPHEDTLKLKNAVFRHRNLLEPNVINAGDSP